jgi:hypothetical protein
MASLKSRFEELIHLPWDEFCILESNKKATVDDVVLCKLIRTCADTDDIAAIKLAFDRIDGLQATLIEIKVPKFYLRYPNATSIEEGTKQIEMPGSANRAEPSNYDPATAKLRETLREMRKLPYDIVRAVFSVKRKVEKALKENIPIPEGDDRPKIPQVKAVITANLLKNVKKGKFKAVELVFDQIDGKLPKAIQLLGGEDVVVDDPTVITAPSHAELGEDGVWRAEDKAMTTQWLRGFANSQKGLEILAEGLDDE